MKKKSAKPNDPEMRAEYAFDYGTGRPNRFASRTPRVLVTVVLDPDVAAVFRTSKSVNTALRSMVATRRATRGTRAPKRKKAD